jgi:hypothetical protein
MWTLLMVVALSLNARSGNLQLLAALRDLRTRGLMQTEQRKVAAFVMRREDGSLNVVMWPHSANYRSEHYEGPVPAGTVAIAHTHPPQADQRPLARRHRAGEEDRDADLRRDPLEPLGG